ncbi:MAG: helix-turn-helix transcriptional regulator [Patescibacteria group bacterium]
MTRTDRLLGILLDLQWKRKCTAEVLAARFEVSPRTIYRDIAALAEIGVPVIAETGLNGGYSLAPDYPLPKVSLDFQEALALYLGLQEVGKAEGIIPDEALTAAKAKLIGIIPAPARPLVEGLGARYSLTEEARGKIDRCTFAELGKAIAGNFTCELLYRSFADDRSRPRTVDPLSLDRKNRRWFLSAWSHEHGEIRTYRVDRISRVALTECPFDPARHMSRPGPQEDRGEARVLVANGSRAQRWLEEAGHQSIETAGSREGWTEFHFPLATNQINYLCQLVLWLGGEAEVLEPEELRAAVRAEAERIAAAHKA